MARSAEPSDGELYRLSRAGDEEAFVALYRRLQQSVFRFCLHMSNDEGVAEDVSQEVFVLVARGAFEFDPARGSLQSLLFGVARNLVRRRTEKNRGLVPIEDEIESGTVPDALVDRTDLLLNMTRAETVARVRQAVASLPAHYREAVVLCDLHEQSYEEAAVTLGCAVGTVRSRLHRGRSMLVERLQPEQAAAEVVAPRASGGMIV